jgi:hypothetical protein
MSPGIGLRQRIVLTQELMYSPLEVVSKAIKKNSLFGTKGVEGKNIVEFLKSHNVDLFKREKEREQLKDDYLIAIGIYSYVVPLINLNIPEEIQSRFIDLLEKRPYELEQPLDIYFRESTEPDDGHVKVFTEIDSDLLGGERTFKRRDFEGRIRQGLREVCQQLDKDDHYTSERHFRFVGYNDICLPLFGIGLDFDELDQLERRLYSTKGSFLMKVPDCLR